MNEKNIFSIRRGLRPVLLLAAIVFSLAATLPVNAEQNTPPAIRSTLNKVIPHQAPDGIRATPIPGIYEASYGTTLLYVSADGRYIIEGDLLDILGKSNISESRRSQVRLDTIGAISENEMVIFAPTAPKHDVTVFTDIDCAYCRKFHSKIDEYQKRGIRIRYLFYPRAGVTSDSYRKAVSVWCSDNRNEAMTKAKAGIPIPRKTCPNPVQKHMAAGDRIGVTGTPTIVLEDGRKLTGYVPPARLGVLVKIPPGVAAVR